MAGTTTNNGWTYPTSTDYVKDGATAIQTLATGIDTSTGKGLIAWQTWAPTLSNGWANGNGTWDARYCQIGKTVFVKALFIVGSTTTKGNNLDVSIPVTAQTLNVASSITTCTVGGGNTNLLFGNLSNTTTYTLFAINASATYLTRNNITATIPATWATNDVLRLNFTYEAA